MRADNDNHYIPDWTIIAPLHFMGEEMAKFSNAAQKLPKHMIVKIAPQVTAILDAMNEIYNALEAAHGNDAS